MNNSPDQPSNSILEPYKNLLGTDVIDQLFQIANLLKGRKIVHVNSTREGGGVAEILHKLVPLMNALGLETKWEVLKGNNDFFQCTKIFHNSLQGRHGRFPSPALIKSYEETNAQNAEELKGVLQEADIVFIHDPQPLPLLSHFPKQKGKWIWRCHIDLSSPSRDSWHYLRKYIEHYDATIFSLEDSAHPLPHPIFLIPPSIDPFSEKNIELDPEEVAGVLKQFNIDQQRPIITQVSRFDRFKDPLGVITAYRLAKKFNPAVQLVLAGGGATDDPEGEAMYHEIAEVAKDDPDIHVLQLPPSPRMINALQRGSNVILQKSVKEGFGLTVTEALWKNKAVIGGDTGGIRLQLINHLTGFLVHTPEGAAIRIRQLLQDPELAAELGAKGKRMVKENFLITRHLREYLTVMATLIEPNGDRIDLSQKIPK